MWTAPRDAWRRRRRDRRRRARRGALAPRASRRTSCATTLPKQRSATGTSSTSARRRPAAEPARAGDTERMHRIFCEQLATGAAQAQLEELAELAGTEPIRLLCFERDPAQCHRRIVAERLEKRGFKTVDLFVI